MEREIRRKKTLRVKILVPLRNKDPSFKFDIALYTIANILYPRNLRSQMA